MRSTTERVWLGALIVGALALRLAYAAATTGLGHPLGRDYREYIRLGRHLVEQGTLASPLITMEMSGTPSALMPPGYAGLVALTYRLFGVESFFATFTLQVVNALATSLTVLFVFWIARRLGGVYAAWAAAAIAVINPTLVGYTTYIWDTSLFALGVTISVYVSLRLGERPAGSAHWLGFGVFLGGLALLNPALTITYPFLVLWPLSQSYGWRVSRMTRPGVAVVFGWALTIAPWTVRNYVHFDKLIYIRSGFMHELWLGVCPEADAHGAAVFRSQFPLLNAEEQRRIASLGEEEYIRARGESARAAIAADPWRLVRLVAVRTVDYWAGTVFSHTPPGEGGWPRSFGRAAVTVFLLAETLVILACLLIRRKLPHDSVWLLAIIVVFSLVYCVTHVQVRYRTPMEPVMAVLVAICAVTTFASRRSSRPHIKGA